MKPRILWLLPPSLAGRLRPEFAQRFQLLTVQSLPEVLLFLRTSDCDAVAVSCASAGAAADDVLLEIRRARAGMPVIFDCVQGRVDDAVRLAKLGAADVSVSETPSPDFAERLEGAVLHVATSAGREQAVDWRSSLVGTSERMQRVADVIELVAARRSTVLITGETGTGKEVVARAIHAAGGRAHLPFVALNCSAIPENLIEAELFGYVKGAFTGAVQSRPGRFEQANGGTVFLDEIGELPAAMQVKLLRVLQEREVQRLGGNDIVRLNVRVIAATNADLEGAVRAKQFREDLYYRLNVVPLRLPALRERLSDIPELVRHFLAKICAAEHVPCKCVQPEVLRQLQRFEWPGNVRQLEHAVEMAVVLSGDRAVLGPEDFALLRAVPHDGASEAAPLITVPDEGLDFDATLSDIERSIVRQALAKSRGNKARAAELLRMKRTTLLAKLKALEEENEQALPFPVASSGGQGLLAAAG